MVTVSMFIKSLKTVYRHNNSKQNILDPDIIDSTEIYAEKDIKITWALHICNYKMLKMKVNSCLLLIEYIDSHVTLKFLSGSSKKRKSRNWDQQFNF